jgi:ADP-heptose:LPS heptosyltransferase
MKTVVNVSAGIGDALMMIPLLERMRRNGNTVTLMIESKWLGKNFFRRDLARSVIASTRLEQILFMLLNFRRFKELVFNQYATGRRHSYLAEWLSTDRRTTLPLPREIQSEVRGVESHNILTNLRLVDRQPEIDWDRFKGRLGDFVQLQPIENLPNRFIAVQTNAGSGVNTFKNWPTEHWMTLFANVLQRHPHLHFVLLGGKEEAPDLETFNVCDDRILNLSGKTSISQAMFVVTRAYAFIGVDGGMMHAAGINGTPSFTLWGPSSPTLYGYSVFNPSLHQVCTLELACAPCNAWINANKTRVANPIDCPDKACMRDMHPNHVIPRFLSFLDSIQEVAR